ncbi:hypothetical protein CHS0354_002451 [Potamilus streckersoni]|uniref:Uncharacterized protein n=1 Tax=Potamilus streckersoni TaxID=2493646 RepID=A0AAE0W993_9BIVA|nr:hypothetical protein CHS0354_002451 [Potamilus streckersoni]
MKTTSVEMKTFKKLKDKSEDDSDSEEHNNGDDDDDEEHKGGGKTGDYDDGELADHSSRKRITSFEVFQPTHDVSVPLDTLAHPKPFIKSSANELPRTSRWGAQRNSGHKTERKPQLPNVVPPISFHPNKPLTLNIINTTKSSNNSKIHTSNNDNQQTISNPTIRTSYPAVTGSIGGLGGTANVNFSNEATNSASLEADDGQLHVGNHSNFKENVTSDFSNHGNPHDAKNLQSLSFSDVTRATEMIPNKENTTAPMTDDSEISFTGVTIFQSFVSSTLEIVAGQSHISREHNLDSNSLATTRSFHPETEGMIPKAFEKSNATLSIIGSLSGGATNHAHAKTTRTFQETNPDVPDNLVSARFHVQKKYKDLDQQMAFDLDKELPSAETFCRDSSAKNPRGKEIKCCENALDCFDDLRETLKTVIQSGYNGEVAQVCNSVEEGMLMQTKCIQKVLDKCDKESRDVLRDRFESKMQLLSSHVQKQCFQDISTASQVIHPKLQASAVHGSGVNNVAFIAGSVLGGVIFIAIIIAILFVWARKKHYENSNGSPRGVKELLSQGGNANQATERRDSVIYEEIDEIFMDPKYALENKQNNRKLIRTSVNLTYHGDQLTNRVKPIQSDKKPLPEPKREYENDGFENPAINVCPEWTKENQYENGYELPKTNTVHEGKKLDTDTKMTMDCLKSDKYENINVNVNSYERLSAMSTIQRNDTKFIETQGPPHLLTIESKAKEAENELPYIYFTMESQSKIPSDRNM